MAGLAEVVGAPAAVLLGSLLLGALSLWFERSRGEPVSADLFFTGNRQLRSLPMTLSLIATLVTPLSWLTLPTAVAHHGVTPALAAALGLVVSAPLAVLIFLPVFFHMQPTTAFEYLEQRFSSSVKLLASGLFVCHTITSLPALLYVPMAVLQQVTGVPLLYGGPIVLVTALAYTALGGMRAVQWASSAHVLVSAAALAAVVALGSTLHSEAGDVSAWELLAKDKPQLLSFMHSDPHGWSTGLGAAFWWGSQLAAGQPQVQRYLSVPLLTQSRMAVVLAMAGMVVLGILQTCAGLLMAAHTSQPVSDLAADEHSLSYYVPFASFALTAVGGVPGLSGLVVTAVCSVMLSSLSSGVHALSAVLTMDVWGGNRWCQARAKVNELPVSRGRWVMALASVLVLLASAVMIFLPEPLLSVALMFPRITGGSLLGLFCLGMLVPWANTAGALVGAVVSLAAVWWASIGESLLDLTSGQYVSVTALVAPAAANATQQTLAGASEPLVPHNWLSPLGCAVTLLLGAVVSGLACPRNPKMLDPDLVSPLTRWIHQRIWGWNIGVDFEDSSVQEDFYYEAVSTSRLDMLASQPMQPHARLGSPYARGGVQQALRRAERRRSGVRGEEDWPDIAYPHLSRAGSANRGLSRPRSGLAWDRNTGELYLSALPPQ